ncbi:hypothetical protein [Colwellia hornerae]|uniref:Uncharacterized protein n=1 Tax=Colwellia hornerae TaxID=89402 RepID=A0A5C6Q2A8_9GAMM|nr:hypothetical protein [Colwellia hornerae]TWX45739.1 hypothetical protein ESZ28_18550 [Colwellia hornerae]TWX53738.1 hypothetical protein ESZ26_18575 [Colwellia hornerae]TWX62989.1 hypothetical protein ESZ27_18375 [Colwellia hornerae]
MKDEFFLELISESVRRIFFIVLSITFILGGAVNIGATGLVFAMPFIFILFNKLDYYQKFTKNITIVILSIICVFFVWNKPQNSLIFPHLNTEIEISAEWAYARISDSTYHPLIAPEHINSWKTDMKSEPDYILRLTVSEKNIFAVMNRVEITHEMFATRLRIIFKDSSGKMYSITPKALIKAVAIGSIKSIDLQGIENFQSTWSHYLGNLMFWPVFPVLLFS